MIIDVSNISSEAADEIVSYIIGRDEKTRIFLFCDFLMDLNSNDFELLKSELSPTNYKSKDNLILDLANSINTLLIKDSKNIYRILFALTLNMQKENIEEWRKAVAKYKSDSNKK